jgi:CRISPR-associated protein Cmr3
MSANTDATAHEHHFIEALDVLFLRGNKLFGDPGSQGDALIPPWPSAAAGALRSQLLAHDGTDLSAFSQGRVNHPSLGTPAQPGAFAITAFTLAREGSNASTETLHPLPADLVVTEQEGGYHIQSLRPLAIGPSLVTSSSFSETPVLPETNRHKACLGLWLTQAGWQRYLQGNLPKPALQPNGDLLKSSDLWGIDSRVGVGLNASTRSADDGKLFTTHAVALKQGVGFLATVRGARLPSHTSLRFGGDGRAAISQLVSLEPPQVDLQSIISQARCRMVLTTPGLFTKGWLPNGVQLQNDGSHRLNLYGVSARLVCASVPRAETISGWDLANWQPKAAQRAAPTGSVYWLDQLKATPEALGKLAESGLWSTPCEDANRRAEGFNRFTFAAYSCT